MNDKHDITTADVDSNDAANEELILVELEERLEFTVPPDGRCTNGHHINPV